MMDNMPACSVETRVCKDKKFKSSEYCTPFSLMSDVCTDMVMGVQGCKDYRQMCVAGNVVSQCQEPSLKNTLPTYMQAQSYVNGICNSMSMPDCDRCIGKKCDYLSVYSDLCLSMPEMKQCAAWKSLCNIVPKWPYCSAEESAIPQMRMYFHTGIVDFVLFYGWVPRNGVQYAFTWIAIAVAGVLLEALKFVRAKLEKKWAQDGSRFLQLQDGSEGETSSPNALPWNWRIDIPRALLAGLELGWGYLLMLVAMTFNVGLFFAVIAGAVIGTLIFGRFLVTLPKQKAVSCH
jgi:copper transporter 1